MQIQKGVSQQTRQSDSNSLDPASIHGKTRSRSIAKFLHKALGLQPIVRLGLYQNYYMKELFGSIKNYEFLSDSDVICCHMITGKR